MDDSVEGELELDFASAAGDAYGLSPDWVRAQQQAAWMCLSEKPHPQPVSLRILSEGEDMGVEVVGLRWTMPDDAMRRTYGDLQEATEWGATSVAMYLLRHFAGYLRFERTYKGPGFDYWASRDEGAVLMNDADRLEVSGLLDGDARRASGRVREKLVQVGGSGLAGREIVAVINFGPPSAHFVFRLGGGSA